MTQPQPLPAAIASTNAPDNNIRIGKVTQTAPLIVSVQGGDVVSPGVLNYANFTVGDIVALVRQDQSWLVLGTTAPGDITLATGQVNYAAATGADTTASGTASELDNARVTWVKRLGTTKARVDFSASCYTTVAATGVMFAMQFMTDPVAGAGPTVNGPAMVINTATEHTMMSSHGLVSGLAAGTYIMRPLWWRTSGTGTLTTDANDWLSYIVSEVN